ncbi:sucrose-phosphatase 2-like [Cynara cardunculus var. scolymus]|uniref:sucrose-phosphatase 2-like n=1 Tax=Cynara cardunculus var. scolymus TaxID=59895 RepID=UPI000D627094|nr:sucrose-phosphatase 2-like [Cynara cardunculus var. scolymus]
MNRLKSPARLMIVSDLDHTMVDHHDPENLSLLRFNALWETKYRHDSLLVFSTGRSPTLYKQLRKEHPMLTPDITIMSVGTEITYGNAMVPDEGWVTVLNHKWDKKIVTEEASKFPELTLQSETEQRPHKASFYVKKEKAQEVMKNLSEILVKRGLDVKIIYSGGMDLDILPQGAGKGQALAYLHKKLKAEGKLPQNTLACGDSGNDAELFTIPDVYGVMVKNAQEELLQWHAENAKDNPKIIHADERCAAGIIQAIGHFKLGPSMSPRDLPNLLDAKLDHFDPAYEAVKFYLLLERWQRAEMQNPEHYLDYLKGVCSPLGAYINPFGVEQSLHDIIGTLKDCSGDKKGKQYRVWVDQVFPVQIDSDTWLVKFKKLEQTGEGQQCCFTTAILSSKDVKPSQGFSWVNVHQTWMDDELTTSGKNWYL